MIKHARARLGFTKAALARELQASAGTTAVTGKEVGRWERAVRIPGPYWRQHLAVVLNIDPELLDHAARLTRQQRRGR